MGTLYWTFKIDQCWFDLDKYIEVSFHYYFGPQADRHRYVYISKDKWPSIRTWILRECEGEVIVSYGNNEFRKWINLHFEVESDAMAFKLKWI